jgi:hypothetical protein
MNRVVVPSRQGYKGWRNQFLENDFWAPEKFKNTSSGEQCTVVFVLMVTKPATEYVCVEGGCGCHTPYAIEDGSVKTTVDCSPVLKF